MEKKLKKLLKLSFLQFTCAIVFTLIFATAGYYVIQETYDGLTVSDSEFQARLKWLRIKQFGNDVSSYDELAKKLDIETDVLKDIEYGRQVASIDFKKRLIEHFTDHTDLLFGKRRPFSTISFYVWAFFGTFVGLFFPALLLIRETTGLDESIDSLLRNKLELTLKDLLGDKIFDNVKSSHVSLLNGYIMETVKAIMKEGKAGIRFFSRMSPGGYATLSTKLDKLVKLEKAFNLFLPEELFCNNEIRNHLTVTNKRAAKEELSVVRVQVITKESYKSFVNPKNPEILKEYNKFYRNASGIKFFWAFESEIAVSYVVQDYIIYDDRLVLIYDKNSQRLELDVGGIVDEYKEIFTSTSLHPSDDFEELLAGAIEYPIK